MTVMSEFQDRVELARAQSIEREVTERGIKLRRSGPHERIGPCPKCGGVDRFSININEGVWNCRQCKPPDIAGDVIGFTEWFDNVDFAGAVDKLAGPGAAKANGANGKHTAPGKLGRILKVYPYHDEAGALLFEVVRYEPKDFRQRRPDGKGGFVYSLDGVRMVPYRLPELIEAVASEQTVFILEGEKDVDAACELLHVHATCNPRGAGKWANCNIDEHFRDAHVVIVADNDPQTVNKKTGEPLTHLDGRPRFAGWDHAMEIAARLDGVAASIRVIDLKRFWPQCPDKGDLSDWIAAGGTVEALNDIAERAPYWAPSLADRGAVHGPPLNYPFPIDERSIPVRLWKVPGLLMSRHVSVVVAPPGSGKSLFTLQLGIACAQGTAWAGWRPRAKFRVMVLNSEDDIDEMRRRLAAATHRMEVDQEAIRDRLCLIDNSDRSAVVAKFDIRSKTLIRTPLLDQIVALIIEHKIDIIFVDPFAETFEGDENSNSELKWAGMLWREVARRTNASVCLVHHTKKYATGMAGDVDAARGAGALIGIARIVSTLFPMTPKEAETMLDEGHQSEHGLYLRYDDAKANLNIKSPFARWFRKETITLDNATETLPGDDVGVLIPWKPKGTSLLEAQINAFFSAIDVGLLDDYKRPTGEFFSFEPRSKERNVIDFACEFLSIPAPSEAKKLISGWRKGKRLQQVWYHSPAARKKRTRVISELDPACPKHHVGDPPPDPEPKLL